MEQYLNKGGNKNICISVYLTGDHGYDYIKKDNNRIINIKLLYLKIIE